jgi:transcriptional regulator with XRE-family HTH domain
MFWNQYTLLCSRKGLAPNAVAKELGIASGSVTNWKNGKMPLNSTLKKIADYFGVSVDYLLGKEEKPATEGDELNEYLEVLKSRPEMRMLFSLAKGATKEDVERAVAIIEALRKNET